MDEPEAGRKTPGSGIELLVCSISRLWPEHRPVLLGQQMRMALDRPGEDEQTGLAAKFVDPVKTVVRSLLLGERTFVLADQEGLVVGALPAAGRGPCYRTWEQSQEFVPVIQARGRD